MPDVIAALVARYGFVQFPQAPHEIIPSEGQSINFGHGKFTHDGRTIVIDTLQVFGNLIIADTGSSTDDADLFMEDMLTHAASVIALDPNHPQMYISQLELYLNAKMSGETPVALATFSALAEAIKGYLPTGWAEKWNHQFELSAISMAIDPSRFGLACDFRLERRVNHPYASHLYASQAPLRTSDHIAVLEAIEKTGKRKGESE